VTATFTRWLELREPADAAARSVELAERLACALGDGPLVIHDLGGGSGSMGRWLAPRLPQPQHWVVHDRDEALLALAVEHPPPGVTVEARRSDITRLPPLEGASAVVASALLDMLTADELAGMLAACEGLPTLLAMTVTGRVTFAPEDPLDAPLGAAFNDHQRREGRLGPDAIAAVGGSPTVRRTPWHLTGGDLLTEWFGGWVTAACEREPALADAAALYRERRLAQAAAGELVVTVDHADLLVLP
jgi:hypothetical protein